MTPTFLSVRRVARHPRRQKCRRSFGSGLAAFGRVARFACLFGGTSAKSQARLCGLPVQSPFAVVPSNNGVPMVAAMRVNVWGQILSLHSQGVALGYRIVFPGFAIIFVLIAVTIGR